MPNSTLNGTVPALLNPNRILVATLSAPNRVTFGFRRPDENGVWDYASPPQTRRLNLNESMSFSLGLQTASCSDIAALIDAGAIWQTPYGGDVKRILGGCGFAFGNLEIGRPSGENAAEVADHKVTVTFRVDSDEQATFTIDSVDSTTQHVLRIDRTPTRILALLLTENVRGVLQTENWENGTPLSIDDQ